MFIGSIMGLALSPAMIAGMGWPSVFYIFGSLGVLWYTAWNHRAASTPSDDPHISREEKVGGLCAECAGDVKGGGLRG
jgi:ACS family sodium-dependent inorganic phosphate cotransporter